MSKPPTYFGFRILPNVTMYRPAGCGTLLLLLAFVPTPIWLAIAWGFAAAHPEGPLGALARLAVKWLVITLVCFIWACFLGYLKYRWSK